MFYFQVFPKEYQRALRQAEEEKMALTNGPTSAVESKPAVKDIEDVVPKLDKIRLVCIIPNSDISLIERPILSHSQFLKNTQNPMKFKYIGQLFLLYA